MLHPYESDSKILHRTPSESHDEWISRITAHPLEEYERETAELLSDTQVKEMVDEVQNIFSQETNEKKDDLGTDSETAKINDQERRSIKLTKILPILAQLWWLNSERLDITTELLANGSRESKTYFTSTFLGFCICFSEKEAQKKSSLTILFRTKNSRN